MINRRDFIKFLGGLGGIILAPIAKYLPYKNDAITLNKPFLAELYQGFIILPYGEKVPYFVEYSNLNTPIFCGVGDSPKITANTITFSSETELAKNVPFPFYTLTEPPEDTESMGGFIVYYSTGDIYSINISYGRKNSISNLVECIVSLWAYPEFPRPFPIWLPDPIESYGRDITILKTTALPIPGLMIIDYPGKSFHWIEDNILYRLIIEDFALQNDQTIINTLRKISDIGTSNQNRMVI